MRSFVSFSSKQWQQNPSRSLESIETETSFTQFYHCVVQPRRWRGSSFGGNYFCSFSQAVYWAFFGSAPLGLLGCWRTGSVQNNLTFTEVRRLLKVRNISRSKIKTVGSPSLVGTVWAEGLKLLHYANRSRSCVCLQSHLPMLLLMAKECLFIDQLHRCQWDCCRTRTTG